MTTKLTNSSRQPTPAPSVSDADFRRLLEFRDGLRRFLRWSSERATEVDLTGAQHQLLLVIRGHGPMPSIGDVAHHLLLRHHSAVGLVDRAEAAGLVERVGDESDRRVVRLRLTPEGERRLAQLSALHLEELARLRDQFSALWADLSVEVDDS